MEMLLLKVRHLIEMKKKMQKAFMQSSTMGIALTEVQASSMDEELMRKAIGYIEEQIANPELSVERLEPGDGHESCELLQEMPFHHG